MSFEGSVKKEPIEDDVGGYSIGAAAQAQHAPQMAPQVPQDMKDVRSSVSASVTPANDAEVAMDQEYYADSADHADHADHARELGQVLPEQPDLKIVRRQVTGYVGFANLPKQWRRKSIRKGFTFNLLCVGTAGLGKTTLVNTLFGRDFAPGAMESNIPGDYQAEMDSVDEKVENLKIEDTDENGIAAMAAAAGVANGQGKAAEEENLTSSIHMEKQSAVIEENGVSLKLTVIDAHGFGDAIDNSDAWQPIVSEVNKRFDQYLDAENRINRGVIEDTRIHACLYFIEPTAHFLKPLDIEFCKQIHEKCNLIPVIAKSDILTDEEIAIFKSRIRRQLDEAGVTLFEPPTYALDDEETVAATKELANKVPYAVVGSTEMVTNSEGKLVRGRTYPWGIIEVDNSAHSDFNFLRDLLIRQYMEELRERTVKVLYEKYRSEKLINLGIKQDNSVFKEYHPETRQKEEKQLHEAKLAKLEAEMKAVFQQKVSEKEKKLQKSEAELFARHKEMKDKLTKQLKALEEKKHQLEISISKQVSQSPVQPKKKGFLR